MASQVVGPFVRQICTFSTFMNAIKLDFLVGTLFCVVASNVVQIFRSHQCAAGDDFQCAIKLSFYG